MTDADSGDLADRLRRTLQAKAELTPRVVGRRQPGRPRHVGWWMPLAAIGVVAVGLAGTVIVATRSGDQGNVTPSAASSLDSAPASTGILLSPPPDAPGLRIGTGSNIEPWPGGVYTTGAVSSPSGRVVIIENDPGEFPTLLDPSAETRHVGDVRVLTWRGIGDLRTYALESPCSNTSIAAINPDAAWTGELQDLLDVTTIDPTGSMHIDLPPGWTSYGAGRLGPGFRYQFTIPVDGTPTTFTVLQRFDTDVGATIRTHQATATTFNDAPALIYEEGQLVFRFAAGPDAVSLAGPVDAETLIEVAQSLDRYNLTVDLDAYRNRYPANEVDTCDRSISITP